MSPVRFFRYLAPNLVTAMSMVFGMLSVVATLEGRYVSAAWLVIWAVLLDRVDGMVARTLRATSAFGVQMDSLADAFNFGAAPAFLVYVSLGSVPELGFASGSGRVLLMVACSMWILAGVFRLAKFNVITDESPAGKHVFYGVATTLAAGLLCIWYLVLHQYASPDAPFGSPELVRGPRLFGALRLPLSAWSYVPPAMIVGALLMASNLPSPKLGKTRYSALNVALLLGVLSGYVCGFARMMPDFMALMPTTWIVGALVWGQVSREARGLRPPPFLPPPGADDDADAEDETADEGDVVHHS